MRVVDIEERKASSAPIRIRILSEEGRPAHTIGAVNFPPGVTHEFHDHPDLESIYVHTGELIITTEEGEHVVPAGSIAHLERKEVHSVRASEPSILTFYFTKN